MWYKWTKRIIAGLGILVVLTISFVLVIVYLFEDEVKQYAVNQLNKQLTVAVDVKEIDLTLIDKFPMASLRFKEVFIPDNSDTTQTDTLLYAKSVYLNFDFWKMLNKEYTVERIDIESANCKFKIDNNGLENYKIWKTDTSNQENSFSFELENVRLNNVHFEYANELAEQQYELLIDQLQCQGKFSNIQYDLKLESDLFLKKFKSGSVNYIKNKKVQLAATLSIDANEQLYAFKAGHLKVEKLNFELSGKYNLKNTELDLLIAGKDIQLTQVYSIFPKQFFESLIRYQTNGIVDFNASISGKMDKATTPLIHADFKMSQASLTEKNTGSQLKHIHLEGSFLSRNNKGKSEIKLNKFKGTLGNGSIEGDFCMSNFKTPRIKTHLKGNLSLAEIKKFINSDVVQRLQGETDFSLYFDGSFLTFETINDKTLRIYENTGKINFKEGYFRANGSHLLFEKMTGTIQLDKKSPKVKSLSGELLGTQFTAEGNLNNLIPYALSSTESLEIYALLKSKRIDLAQLLKTPDQIGNNEQIDGLQFPKRLVLGMDLDVSSIDYGKFSATQVSGKISLKDGILSGKKVTFKNSKGNFLINTELEATDHVFLWSLDADASKIDIARFFEEMDDFGQTFMSYKNIDGRADIKLDMATVLDPKMNIDITKLYAKAKVNISKGELIQQPTLLEIGDYLAGNNYTKKLLKTDKLQKKLEHIKFDHLQNEITIKDGIITIPEMTIKSNLIDLELSGTHGFDDAIDYHFNFRLRELLNPKSDEEFGPVKDDGLGIKIFLHLYGSVNDPIFEIDQQEKKTTRKEEIQEEKQALKSILKQEFGLFKKDSVKVEAAKIDQPTFELEWDEDDEIDSTENEDDKKARDKKKRGNLQKLKKKLGINEKEEQPELEIEIEL